MAVSDHGRGAEQISLRLPDGMRDRIKSAAAAQNRSMNAEIIATLVEAYPTPISFNELARKTRILTEEVKRFRSTSSLVELHNVLSQAVFELKKLEEGKGEDQFENPS